MTFRKAKSSCFTTTSFTIMIENFMSNKVMKTTPNSVILIISMIKSWIGFFFLVRKHNIDFVLILRSRTFIHKVVDFRFVKFVMEFLIDLILFDKIEENIFTWYSTTDLTSLFGLFYWLVTDPYTKKTWIIRKDLYSHVDKWAMNKTDYRSALGWLFWISLFV